MEILSIIIIVLICLIIGSILFLAVYCFNDDDQDQFWYNEFATGDCPHENQSKVNVSSAVNCETIHTVCDDCSQVLNVEIDCR